MDAHTTKITLEQILELLEKRYELVYIDRDCSFDESLESVAKSIRTQDWSYLDESISDWEMDAQMDGEDYAIKELNNNLCREFDIEEDEADELIERYIDEIRDEIYNRDESTVLQDMIRNTTDPVMFYDLDEDIEFDVPFGTEKDLKDCLKQIKKSLKIKLSETKYDRDIELMIEQGYSGRLVIYFNADIQDMMKLSDKNVVTFSNPAVAIINTWNGSGDHCFLKGHKFTIPFNIENFFMDKETHYSYTYQVCGMYSSWCDCTGVNFSTKKVKSIPNSSKLHEEQGQEQKYKEVFKSGKCSFGDMDMRRHRGTYYLNEFPCGTHCPHCHTFWID